MSRSRRAASGFISGYLMVAVTLAVQIVMVPMATGALDGDEALKQAPYYSPRRRLDETGAARKPKLAYEG